MRMFACFAALLAACIFSARLTAVEASLEGQWRSSRGDLQHVHFNEFGDPGRLASGVQESAALGLGLADAPLFFGVDFACRQYADELRLTGAEGQAVLGQRGLWQANLDYRRSGHQYGLDIPSLYDKASLGTGVLTMPAASQTYVQGSTTAALPARLRSLLAAGNRLDLAVTRDKTGVTAAWTPVSWLGLSVRAAQERRTGTMPYGANFGSVSAVQIAAPVDDFHTLFESGANLKVGGTRASASWRHSQYTNAVESVAFANPFRASDRYVTFTVRSQAPNTLGAAYGRAALAPSNRCDWVNLSLQQGALPMGGRLSGAWDASWARQSAPLLPFTYAEVLNGVPGTPAAPTAPADSAAGAVDTWKARLACDARPLTFLRLKAFGERSSRMNNTPTLVFPVAVRFDSQYVTSTSYATAPYVSSQRNEGGLEAALELPWHSEWEAAYEREAEQFTNGSASDLAVESWSVGVNNHAFAWSRLRLGYERSLRRGNYLASDSEMRYMQKYYAADKCRSRVSGSWELNTEAFEAGLSASHHVDDYDNNWFGLLRDEAASVSASVDWEPLGWLTLSPSCTFETRMMRQRQRSWSATKGNPYMASVQGDPRDDPNNYGVDDYERSQTLEMSARVELLPDFWDLSADGAYTLTRGWLDLYSPAANSAVDNTPWAMSGFGDVDDAKEVSLGARSRVQVNDSTSVSLGWRWQSWECDDFNYDGADAVAVTAAGAFNGVVTLPLAPANAQVQVWTLSLDSRY